MPILLIRFQTEHFLLVEMEGVEPSSGRPGTQPSTRVVPLLERGFRILQKQETRF